MWCGPNSVAYLTHWTREQVWLHVRYLREQRGQRLPDLPVGGVEVGDILDAINRAGYDAEPVWPDARRMRYDRFVSMYGRCARLRYATAKYLLLQNRHFFAWAADRPLNCPPDGIIVRAWRITKRRVPSITE